MRPQPGDVDDGFGGSEGSDDTVDAGYGGSGAGEIVDGYAMDGGFDGELFGGAWRRGGSVADRVDRGRTGSRGCCRRVAKTVPSACSQRRPLTGCLQDL